MNTVFTRVIHPLFLTKILYLNLGCVIYARKRFYAVLIYVRALYNNCFIIPTSAQFFNTLKTNKLFKIRHETF